MCCVEGAAVRPGILPQLPPLSPPSLGQSVGHYSQLPCLPPPQTGCSASPPRASPFQQRKASGSGGSQRFPCRLSRQPFTAILPPASRGAARSPRTPRTAKSDPPLAEKQCLSGKAVGILQECWPSPAPPQLMCPRRPKHVTLRGHEGPKRSQNEQCHLLLCEPLTGHAHPHTDTPLRANVRVEQLLEF